MNFKIKHKIPGRIRVHMGQSRMSPLDNARVVRGMRFNKVDIAWYGNLSAMEAVDRANGQVFAQTVAADGSPGYWSVLIVNKDSPINNLNDLLAKRPGSAISGLPNFIPFAFATAMPCLTHFMAKYF